MGLIAMVEFADKPQQAFFSAEVLADPPVGMDIKYPPSPDEVEEGEEVDMTGAIVTIFGRIYRLTGYVHERYGYEGVWPD